MLDRMERLWARVKPHAIWGWIVLGVILIIGGLLLEAGSPGGRAAAGVASGTPSPSLWHAVGTFLRSAGIAALGGGVASAVMQSLRMSAMFEEELLALFRSPQFKETLVDAVHFTGDVHDDHSTGQLWLRVAALVGRRRFPALTTEFTEAVRQRMTPEIQLDYYLENYDHTLAIESFQDGIVTIVETVTGHMRSSTTDPITYTARFRKPASAIAGEAPMLALQRARITAMNGSRRTWERTEFAVMPEHDGRFLRCEIALEVEGATEYRLERIVQKRFRLLEDPYSIPMFNRYVHNLYVSVTNKVPERIGVRVRGISFEFDDTGEGGEVPPVGGQAPIDTCTKRGLIFPRDSMIIMFHVLPSEA